MVLDTTENKIQPFPLEVCVRVGRDTLNKFEATVVDGGRRVGKGCEGGLRNLKDVQKFGGIGL